MKPLCIAHRGRHIDYHENTIEAFKEAGKMDFFGIETDIHLSKDNKWVIHHNFSIVSNGVEYPIKDYTAEELYKMPLDNKIGHTNAHVLPFEDYLAVCKETGKRPIIEIKPTNPPRKYLKSLMKYIDEFMGVENVTIIAFHPQPLLKIRAMYGKRIHLQHLISNHHSKFLVKLSKRHHMDIDMDQNYLTQDIIDYMHKHNLKVNVWTIWDREHLEKFEKMGVDYVTTDCFCQND